MTSLIGPLLRERVRRAGADPLLTYYEPGAGVRVELSAVTFANWVDKTSNLLVDELMVEPGAVVALELARTAPGHWMTACWELACWQVGVTVSAGGGLSPALVVTGPDPDLVAGDVDVVACSLHPLGLGSSSTPPGVIDYATEVRGQPDVYSPAPVSGMALAWADETRHLSQADLVAAAAGDARRRLLRPSDPWTTARDGIVTALVTGGSTVAVVGGGPAVIAQLSATERIDG